MSADSDIGLSVGQTYEWQEYGFRFFPYRNRLRLAYALNPVRLFARGFASWEFPIGRRGFEGVLELEGISREVRWFYGVGNETPDTAGKEFHRADRALASVAPGLRFRPTDRISLGLGVIAWHSRAVDKDEPTYIVGVRSPELDAVTQAGVTLGASFDFRDSPVVARSGARLEVEARHVPTVLDATEAYTTVRAEASANLAIGEPVLSVRVGGAHLFGDAPYFELPQIGGKDDLRGYVENRFTGESALYGGAHFRAPLTEFFAFFPGTLGLSALVDAGRVFVDGESSRTLHVGYGGGLWATLVRRDLLLNANAVRSPEGVRFYFRLDFPY